MHYSVILINESQMWDELQPLYQQFSAVYTPQSVREAKKTTVICIKTTYVTVHSNITVVVDCTMLLHSSVIWTRLTLPQLQTKVQLETAQHNVYLHMPPADSAGMRPPS